MSDKNYVKKIALDSRSNFVCAETGEIVNSLIEEYSRFKFGDVSAIRSLSSATAEMFIEVLEEGGEIRAVFERAKNRGEFLYMQSPGIRNVASSSNHLMIEVASKVNVWLAQNGLPTVIKKTVGRLASGIANYAELSLEDRKSRLKTTVSLLPESDYSAWPINVIFIDDAEVTGCTQERAKAACLNSGALSFSPFFLLRVEQSHAQKDAAIENLMNQCSVNGSLDNSVAAVLAHPDYRPVQRMLRLLLNKQNRKQLFDFAMFKVPINRPSPEALVTISPDSDENPSCFEPIAESMYF
ncbi:phosphoribosyltransferase family protein [Akkermansiaceae bacterium]|nr:phosphoribosyltransferase family protein [Akkermansiaceae bacterium]